MSFPPHTSYKPSGYDWLGNIPSDWRIQKFRHLFSESSEKIESEVFGEMLSVSGYRGIERKEYDDENRRRKDEDLIGYRIVRRGQLVVNTMWLNYAGLGFSDLDGHVSPAYRAYWPRTEESSKYLHYLLRSEFYVKGYTRLLTGVRPNSLQMSRDNMMSFPVILPNRPEQVAIASFLDRETAKIDALITEQQRLIELLQEKRQAVISHAVTKGLNPNAPMKDSGVEWLGEVPEHWEVAQIRRYIQKDRKITYGIVQPGEPDPNGRFMVRGQDYSNGWVSPDLIFRVSPMVEEPYSRSRLLPNDLVMTIVGAGIGNTAKVPDWLDGANLTQTTCRLAVDPGLMNADFMRLVLESHLGRQSVGFYAKGAAQPGLNLEHVKMFMVTCPPLEEQTEIVGRLEKDVGGLEGLKKESMAAAALLLERRSALISAAVTGQIDVRGLVKEEEP